MLSIYIPPCLACCLNGDAPHLMRSKVLRPLGCLVMGILGCTAPYIFPTVVVHTTLTAIILSYNDDIINVNDSFPGRSNDFVVGVTSGEW